MLYPLISANSRAAIRLLRHYHAATAAVCTARVDPRADIPVGGDEHLCQLADLERRQTGWGRYDGDHRPQPRRHDPGSAPTIPRGPPCRPSSPGPRPPSGAVMMWKERGGHRTVQRIDQHDPEPTQDEERELPETIQGTKTDPPTVHRRPKQPSKV